MIFRVDAASSKSQHSWTEPVVSDAATPWRERPPPIFSVSQYGEANVIRVHHDLDYSTSASLGAAIRLTAAGSRRHLVVSLEHCRSCDASALRVLLGAKVTMGSRLSVVAPATPSVRLIFEITRLTKHLGLCDDLDEALQQGERCAN